MLRNPVTRQISLMTLGVGVIRWLPFPIPMHRTVRPISGRARTSVDESKNYRNSIAHIYMCMSVGKLPAHRPPSADDVSPPPPPMCRRRLKNVVNILLVVDYLITVGGHKPHKHKESVKFALKS